MEAAAAPLSFHCAAGGCLAADRGGDPHRVAAVAITVSMSVLRVITSGTEVSVCAQPDGRDRNGPGDRLHPAAHQSIP